jgi:hypothetical protein
MRLLIIIFLTLNVSQAEDFDWGAISKPGYNMFDEQNDYSNNTAPTTNSMYGSNGQYSGKVINRANGTGLIYDSNGHVAGSYKVINGQTFIYNKNGQFVGKVK